MDLLINYFYYLVVLQLLHLLQLLPPLQQVHVVQRLQPVLHGITSKYNTIPLTGASVTFSLGAKPKTSKTQISDPKNSDPLGISKTQTLKLKTQTPWLLYLNQILCTIRFWVLLNIHKQLAESNFILTLAILLVLLGILCELFSEDHAGDLNIMLQISKNMLGHLLCKTAVSLKSP